MARIDHWTHSLTGDINADKYVVGQNCFIFNSFRCKGDQIASNKSYAVALVNKQPLTLTAPDGMFFITDNSQNVTNETLPEVEEKEEVIKDVNNVNKCLSCEVDQTNLKECDFKDEEKLYDIDKLLRDNQELSLHEIYKVFTNNLKQKIHFQFPKTLKHEKQKLHIGNRCHKEAIEQANGICYRFEDSRQTIPLQSDSTLKNRQQMYPYIVETLGRIVHLMGKQGLTFRGTYKKRMENSDQKGNPRNFLAIVQEIARHNAELNTHIQTPLRKDVSYLSPKSQNELIDIIGKKCIQERLINEIKAANYYSISADEVTTANQQILSVCIKYINGEKEIREVFLNFMNLDRITGKHIGESLMKFYSESGVDLSSC
ncbi:uncharacterized protein LOC136074574 [Hydra vulgaris]|uniref:Uncharacterized protein LOC136074574 n=1 Tax=Hydra vulgaris TaxID=6087 RepID=A0ABM4B2G3_HYDVU